MNCQPHSSIYLTPSTSSNHYLHSLLISLNLKLEAEYWESLGPAEREAEERTAAGTKALTEGRFKDALDDFDRCVKDSKIDYFGQI